MIGLVVVPALVIALDAPRVKLPKILHKSPATASVSMVAHGAGVAEFVASAHVPVPSLVTYRVVRAINSLQAL